MKMTQIALKRPVTTFMLFLCFLVTGALSSKLLPLEYLPSVNFPGIFIDIPYPNSTAEEIERRITRPAEEVLATMSGVKLMNSTSTDNAAQIFLQFDWNNSINKKHQYIKYSFERH